MSFDPRWGDDRRDDGNDDRDRLGASAIVIITQTSAEIWAGAEAPRRTPRRTPSAGRRTIAGPRSRSGPDPRDVFTRHVDLPRGRDREIVHDIREWAYTLRGSESRTLAIVGSFRVVSARHLRDQNDRPADPRQGDLRHLREQGLVQTVRLDGRRDVAVALTIAVVTYPESHRDRGHEPRQVFDRASNGSASSTTTPRFTAVPARGGTSGRA